MDWGRTAALANLGLAALASVGYLLQGQWRNGIYWGAAAVITGSVTIGVTK